MILNICNKPSIWHLLLFLLFSPRPAQALSIEMATQPGKMKYDVEVFGVRPGEQVRLTFLNNDEMQHNLLILQGKEGITLKVAQMAWALGPGAVEKEFVPDMDETVLAHTVKAAACFADRAARIKADYGVTPTLIPGSELTQMGS